MAFAGPHLSVRRYGATHGNKLFFVTVDKGTNTCVEYMFRVGEDNMELETLTVLPLRFVYHTTFRISQKLCPADGWLQNIRHSRSSSTPDSIAESTAVSLAIAIHRIYWNVPTVGVLRDLRQMLKEDHGHRIRFDDEPCWLCTERGDFACAMATESAGIFKSKMHNRYHHE